MTKIIKKTLLLSTVSLGFISQSFAATPISGPYIRGFGGYAYTDNIINTNGITASSFHGGYHVGGELGYKSGPIRYELEALYSYKRLKGFSLNGVPQTTVNGSSKSTSGMLNLYYDFEDFSPMLAPYLGVGIGYSQIANNINSSAPTVSGYNQKHFLFSYQGIAGINLNFSENISFDVGCRYFRTRNSAKFNKAYHSTLASIGVTYRFNK